MLTKDLHSWDISLAQARQLQADLAVKVVFTPIKGEVELIAGLDCAFSKDGEKIIAVAVVLKLPDFELVETAVEAQKVTLPYIPGLLSFREGPACIAAVKKLKSEPDVFIIDGQGIAHGRRLGLASHLGLFFDKPTIGCAKSRLIGQYEEPAIEKGSFTDLTDKNEIVGAVVRTRTNVKPVFVSVGNKCILKDAVRIVLTCATKYRLPEPTRIAHQTVSKAKLNIAVDSLK